MQKCPNCGEETITNLSKFRLGPAGTIECNNCKASVSISWYMMLFVIGIIVVLNLISDMYGPIVGWVIFAALMLAYTYIMWKFIPLRVRKSKG